MSPAKANRDARAELQAWYLRDLQPRLARATRTGAADGRAIEALDDAVRALLDLTQGREEAA